jgi:hypothetical protein
MQDSGLSHRPPGEEFSTDGRRAAQMQGEIDFRSDYASVMRRLLPSLFIYLLHLRPSAEKTSECRTARFSKYGLCRRGYL